MPDEGSGEAEEEGLVEDPPDNSTSLNGSQKGGDIGRLSEGRNLPEVLTVNTLHIVTSQPEEIPNLKTSISKYTARDDIIITLTADSPKKEFLSRSDSCQEQCRVFQQQTEEPLIELGCIYRGELAKAHRTCIDIWFRTKGSNMCEICQQVAANVSVPETQPSASYWVWRVDSAYTGRRGDCRRGCINPLWVAFAILIGGLLLDVLISVSLGVSALPVNIIIGIFSILHANDQIQPRL